MNAPSFTIAPRTSRRTVEPGGPAAPGSGERGAGAPKRGPRRLAIAVVAPPWIPIPPPAYGGIEAVVALLCEELVERGHRVTLFAAPGSESPAELRMPLERVHDDQIGSSLHESDHVGAAYDAIDLAAVEGRPFDVVHDHSGFTAVAMGHRVATPVVHTLHAPFNEETRPFYARHGHKVRLVAISRFQLEHAPPGVRVPDVVPNPIRVGDWPFYEDKEDYLLWVGRMDPVKGAHRAIEVARAADLRLILAGPIQPGQEGYFHREIEPRLDGEEVVYVGEVGGVRRKELFARARAFLMPIRWAEPFGMVIVEALACGTPVITFPEGAANEIVIDGENGFHVADEHAMAEAVGRLERIDPARCRESVASRYDVAIVADGYEAVYERAIRAAGAAAISAAATGPKVIPQPPEPIRIARVLTT
ncbi:MAG TPA: glycosyltransferase family 4 protein [Solirubrobacteraceae bacterium]|nr:glycosyltransferase family 4 protein [Solirubrobacteraceae bacterium]